MCVCGAMRFALTEPGSLPFHATSGLQVRVASCQVVFVVGGCFVGR